MATDDWSTSAQGRSADDLSIFALAGRVDTAAPAVAEAVEAERLGFRRVFLAERYGVKEAGAVLGGAAAATSHIGLGTAAMHPGSRPPLISAALGATMHSAYGPRFVLGLGRGVSLAQQGLPTFSYAALVDYASIVRRLWQGESVTYDGPAGSYPALQLLDRPEGPAPELWSVNQGGPRSCKVAVNTVFDGVLIGYLNTPSAFEGIASVLKRECEQIGRDPTTLRVCAVVQSAPELDEIQTRSVVHARIIQMIQVPGVGESVCRANVWDEKVMNEIRNHPLLEAMARVSVDETFRREQLAELFDLVPDKWAEESALVGSAEECAKKLQAYRDAGADEVVLNGTTPAQNAGLIAAWLQQSTGLLREEVPSHGA